MSGSQKYSIGARGDDISGLAAQTLNIQELVASLRLDEDVLAVVKVDDLISNIKDVPFEQIQKEVENIRGSMGLGMQYNMLAAQSGQHLRQSQIMRVNKTVLEIGNILESDIKNYDQVI